MEDGVPEIKDMVFLDDREKGEEGVNKESEKNSGGGAISNFISALVSKNGDAKVGMEETKQQEEEEEKGGGIFNNLISGILHNGDEDGNHQGNGAEAGAGGLIDTLVSHLPPPLADDAAPAPDEASILIHSIIHD